MPRRKAVEVMGPPTPKEMQKFAIDDLVRQTVQNHPEVKKIEQQVRREIMAGVRNAEKERTNSRRKTVTRRKT